MTRFVYGVTEGAKPSHRAVGFETWHDAQVAVDSFLSTAPKHKVNEGSGEIEDIHYNLTIWAREVGDWKVVDREQETGEVDGADPQS